MKIIYSLLLHCSILLGQEIDLNTLFERASQNSLSCDSLITYCQNQYDVLHQGFLAGGNMLMAKHESSTYKKIKLFQKGKRKLENLINKYPKFVTLKWIRYCIQINAPKFLLYYKKIEEDKNYINMHGTQYQQKSIQKSKLYVN